VSVVASGKLSGKLSRRLLASMACADVLIVVRAGKFTGGLQGIVSRCRGSIRSRSGVSIWAVKYTDIAVRSLTCHTATGTGIHVPYRIAECYLPPDRADIPAFTPAEAGTRLSDPRGMQG